jgi:hypothetical protein
MQVRNNVKLAHSNFYLTYNLSSSLCAVAYIHKKYANNVSVASAKNLVAVAYADNAHTLVQQQLHYSKLAKLQKQ